MFRRLLPKRWQTNRWLVRLVEFGGLFLVLLVALWLVTQRREAPQMILLALLYIITVNFSLPVALGAVGLVPVVAVLSLLLLGLETAVVLTAGSLLLAEFARPLWAPVWENIHAPRPSWRQRMATAVALLLAMVAGGLIYTWTGGSIPPQVSGASLLDFLALALAFGASTIGLIAAAAVVAGRPLRRFLRDDLFSLATAALIALPLALFGAVTYTLGGLPLFVIFAISLVFVAILVWFTWQRNFVLEQQLAQFVALNSIGASLRETLELPQVLARTYTQVAALVTADYYAITLLDADGSWQPPLVFDRSGQRWKADPQRPYAPDDLTRWVAENERVLELTPQNRHFAARHGLQLPQPLPEAWLGVPMRTADATIGVLVVQQFPPNKPFSRWSREVLLALAGQASAAIQNARLYSETLRLYNLTDEALARRVEQLDALLDTMQQGVLMLDSHGRVLLLNTVAEALLEEDGERLSGQPLDVARVAERIGYATAVLEERLQQLQQAGTPTRSQATYAVALRDRAGGVRRRYIERTEAPVKVGGADDGDTPQIIGWLMLFRDVTEERELAERRTDLTRMIVHDLRNPVTTFMTSMSLIERLLPPDMTQARTAVGDARQSSHDMLDMVDSLLDINRIEAGQLAIDEDALNLVTLAGKVTQRLQALAEQRQIALRCERLGEIPAVWGDEDMIRRVLVNLIDNALKFTPAGGEVVCRITLEAPLLPGREAGARCVVLDTGPGIPPALQDRVFDRFVRTNEGGAQIRGTGLGLTFCKLTVEAHHGRIWVEDRPGGGSQFVFVLPGVPVLQDGEEQDAE